MCTHGNKLCIHTFTFGTLHVFSVLHRKMALTFMRNSEEKNTYKIGFEHLLRKYSLVIKNTTTVLIFKETRNTAVLPPSCIPIISSDWFTNFRSASKPKVIYIDSVVYRLYLRVLLQIYTDVPIDSITLLR